MEDQAGAPCCPCLARQTHGCALGIAEVPVQERER